MSDSVVSHTVSLGGSDGIHYLRPVEHTLEILNYASPDKLEMEYNINWKGCGRSTMARRNVGISSAIRKGFSATISIILTFSGSELEFVVHFERAVKSYRSGKDRKMEVIPLYIYLTSNALLILHT